MFVVYTSDKLIVFFSGLKTPTTLSGPCGVGTPEGSDTRPSGHTPRRLLDLGGDGCPRHHSRRPCEDQVLPDPPTSRADRRTLFLTGSHGPGPVPSLLHPHDSTAAPSREDTTPLSRHPWVINSSKNIVEVPLHRLIIELGNSILANSGGRIVQVKMEN